MSDTPRTEKFLEGLWNPDIHGDFNHISDFARQLERELNEAKAELARRDAVDLPREIQESAGVVILLEQELAKVTAERDALLSACKELYTLKEHAFHMRGEFTLATEIADFDMAEAAIAKVGMIVTRKTWRHIP